MRWKLQPKLEYLTNVLLRIIRRENLNIVGKKELLKMVNNEVSSKYWLRIRQLRYVIGNQKEYKFNNKKGETYEIKQK